MLDKLEQELAFEPNGDDEKETARRIIRQFIDNKLTTKYEVNQYGESLLMYEIINIIKRFWKQD